MPDHDIELVDAAEVLRDLQTGIEALAASVASKDMGRITWQALAVAERAQHWAEYTVSIKDDTEDRRFFSMEGLLCDASGSALNADGTRFPFLARAFAAGQGEDE